MSRRNKNRKAHSASAAVSSEPTEGGPGVETALISLLQDTRWETDPLGVLEALDLFLRNTWPCEGDGCPVTLTEEATATIYSSCEDWLRDIHVVGVGSEWKLTAVGENMGTGVIALKDIEVSYFQVFTSSRLTISCDAYRKERESWRFPVKQCSQQTLGKHVRIVISVLY